jgi:hypothetical protein
MASAEDGPFKESYDASVARGIRPEMVRRCGCSCCLPWTERSCGDSLPREHSPKLPQGCSGEECNIFTLHLILYQGLHPVAAHPAERECDARNEPKKQRN